MSKLTLLRTSKLFQLTSLSVALTLVGCGGGGRDTVDSIAPRPDLGIIDNNNGDAGSGSTVEPEFYLQKIIAEPNIVELKRNEPTQFTVTVKAVQEATGGAMANKEITLSVIDSQATGVTIDGASTQSTNNEGNVSYTLTFNPNALDSQYRQQLINNLLNNGIMLKATTKTAQGKLVEQSAIINVGESGSTTSSSSTISLEAQTQGTLNLNGGEVQVQVIAENNSTGNAVSGQDITLALPANIVKQGVTVTSSPTQTTDNSGVAIFTLAVPSGLTSAQKAAIGGNFRVNLTAMDGNGNKVRQVLTISTIRPSTANESLSISASKRVNTNGDTFKVFVRMGRGNNGISGQEVRLSVINPLATGVRITGNDVVTTDGNGIAEFNLTVEPGTSTSSNLRGIGVIATAIATNGVSISSSYNVPVIEKTNSRYVIMSAADKVELNTGGDQTNVTFRILDQNGGAAAGVPVQLSVKNPEQSGAALTANSVLKTNAQGIVTTGVVLAGNSIESKLNHSIIVMAKVIPSETSGGSVTEEVVLQAVGTTIDVDASKTNLTSADDKVTLTAKVADAAGKPIKGATVKWVDKDKKSVVRQTSNTDSTGVATVTVKESDLKFDKNGNVNIFAEVSGKQSRISQVSSNSVTLIKTSQAGISFENLKEIYDVNKTQNINLQIRDSNPKDLIGKIVELQTTLGNLDNSGVVIYKTITASMVDESKNIITLPIKLMSSQAGTAVLTATVTGQKNTAGEPLTTTVDTRFRATTPDKLLLEPVKSVLKPGGSTDIVAIVKDANDVPVEGVTVIFRNPRNASAGRLSAATAVTNAQGEAKVTYTANTSTPINGVEIEAYLQGNSRIPTKKINLTVSDKAVYTTLSFSDKLAVSSDNIYYIKSGSIAVMDGTGRPIANKEVSLKSYATAYAQGLVCLLERSVSYQPKNTVSSTGETVVPEIQEYTEQTAEVFRSVWIPTEDGNYNYILDHNEDMNSNNTLQAINPVTILGGRLADDKYTFITDNEGKVDFQIRYPKTYSSWTQVEFEATTLLNGSENSQKFKYNLPVLEDDLSINSDRIITPYRNNRSPFGVGNQVCIGSLSITVNENTNRTVISGGVLGMGNSSLPSELFVNGSKKGQTLVLPNRKTFSYSFNEAFDKGSLIQVTVGGSEVHQIIKIK